MTNITNIQVYYDDNTDPNNPGWVVSWDDQFPSMTAQLNASSFDEAIAEAAQYLGVDVEDIEGGE